MGLRKEQPGPTLFDDEPSPIVRTRSGDPETSRAAAATITRKKIRQSQEEVLGLFREFRTMSDKELVFMAVARGTSQSHSGLRTRRNELVVAKVLRNTGEKRKFNGARCASIVWGLA